MGVAQKRKRPYGRDRNMRKVWITHTSRTECWRHMHIPLMLYAQGFVESYNRTWLFGTLGKVTPT